jgi:uncharacterized protein YbjT (DUF2867 family)
MTKVLILGAHGQIARVATDLFLAKSDARLTLYLRNARRLSGIAHPERVRLVEGDVMDAEGVKRLIFISSMGIYDEVPGQRYDSILDPYRNAAQVIESSDLDYTIVRPAWLISSSTCRQLVSPSTGRRSPNSTGCGKPASRNGGRNGCVNSCS